MKRTRPYTRRIAPYFLVLALFSLLAGPAAAQEPTSEPSVYVVQRGDTLYGIAERLGTTVEAIVTANAIDDPSLIVVGQKLKIPSGSEGTVPPPGPSPHIRLHTVRPGETLPFLAFRYGTTVPALRAVNEIHRLGLLLPGQILTIPEPVAATAGTPAFPSLSAKPTPVVQGRTMRILVQGDGALELSGQFLEKDLVFVAEEDRYWALIGVDALTPPGGYALTLTAVEVDSGDRLTMQETFTVTAGTFPTYNVVVSEDRQSLLAPKVVQAERKKVGQVFGQVSTERLWDGLFAPPLRGELRITAPFGQRRSYSGGPVSSYHSGLDYGADTGEPVFAPITGTVVLAEPLQVRGKGVILDHGWGVFTGFWHLSQIDVELGQVLGQGERVGLVGNTGLSTGPHLHWEMQVHGVPVNPLQWTRTKFP